MPKGKFHKRAILRDEEKATQLATATARVVALEEWKIARLRHDLEERDVLMAEVVVLRGRIERRCRLRVLQLLNECDRLKAETAALNASDVAAKASGIEDAVRKGLLNREPLHDPLAKGWHDPRIVRDVIRLNEIAMDKTVAIGVVRRRGMTDEQVRLIQRARGCR